MAKY